MDGAVVLDDRHDQAPDVRDAYGQSEANQKLVEHCWKLIRRTRVNDPLWRKKAQESVDFFYDKQWRPADKQAVEARGQDPIVFNRIKPGIRLLIGLMLSMPFDWQAKPVGAHDDETAEAVSAGLKYLGNVNRAYPGLWRWVYWWGLSYGMAVVRVGPHVRWKNPKREPCQLRLVDPREVGVDPDAREPDRSDLRFLDWRRRLDLEEAKKTWPKLAPDLDAQVTTREPDDTAETGGVQVNNAPIDMTPPPSMWEDFADWNRYGDEEVDREAKKVTVHEVWEYRDERVWLADMGDGTPPIEVSPEERTAYLLNPQVKAMWQDSVPKPWRHIVCGPLLLQSDKQDAKHERIPFAFYIYDQDDKGNPVSAIESVKDMQREENYRRAKGLYELGNQPIIVDPAVAAAMGMTVEQLAEHAAKRSPVWLGLANQIAYPNAGSISAQQFELMQQSELSIQKGLGTNDHLMGYDTPAESGKSKELSMQQGATINRDGESGLRAFHVSVGELLLSDMCQYHGDGWMFQVSDHLGQSKSYALNQPQAVQQGPVSLVGDINRYQYHIELETVPWSPTARQRAAERIATLYQAEEDPMIRAALRRMAITLDDLPNKAEIMRILDDAEKMRQQAQPDPTHKSLTEQIRLTDQSITPFEVGQLLAKEGIQPDPSRQPGQPPAGQQMTGPTADPNAPPPPDPNKLAQLQLDAAKHDATLQHQAGQAEADRAHQAQMAVLQAQLGAAATDQQHQNTLEQGQQAADLAPPPPSGGGSA